ncbi:hypothetical protein GCM10007242_01200 [Pigmentiphaga litoralis]|nr:hypothetical protein GCM10007242_01200 [Pigmentiphaga litoralis]
MNRASATASKGTIESTDVKVRLDATWVMRSSSARLAANRKRRPIRLSIDSFAVQRARNAARRAAMPRGVSECASGGAASDGPAAGAGAACGAESGCESGRAAGVPAGVLSDGMRKVMTRDNTGL